MLSSTQDGGDLIIDLNGSDETSPSGTLIVKGNVVVTDHLTATDATISGILVANQVVADEIVSPTIDRLIASVSALTSQTPDSRLLTTTVASHSSRLDTLESLSQHHQSDLDALKSSIWDSSSHTNYYPLPTTNEASTSGLLTHQSSLIEDLQFQYASLSAEFAQYSILDTQYQASISGDLNVFGLEQLELRNLGVEESAVFGSDLMITNNTLQTIATDTLYLQPAGGNLNVLAGLMTLSSDGNTVAINGDLEVSGKITAQSGEFDDLTASTASFSAIIANQLDTSNLRSASISSTLLTTEEIAIATNSAKPGSETIGRAILPTGNNQVLVLAKSVKDSTKVFVTPTTITSQVVTVTHIIPSQGFIVETSTPVDSDLTFNWWIIN